MVAAGENMVTSMQHLALLSDMCKLDSSYIIIWADGTWCYPEELEQYGHMSDDAQRWFYQNGSYDEEELEQAVAMLNRGCSAAYVHYALQDARKRRQRMRRLSCSSGA
jgi:hypothetical protein